MGTGLCGISRLTELERLIHTTPTKTIQILESLNFIIKGIKKAQICKQIQALSTKVSK
jgi:hypothetical protein